MESLLALFQGLGFKVQGLGLGFIWIIGFMDRLTLFEELGFKVLPSFFQHPMQLRHLTYSVSSYAHKAFLQKSLMSGGNTPGACKALLHTSLMSVRYECKALLH